MPHEPTQTHNSPGVVDRLRAALEQAIVECIEHNSDYHHRTPTAVLARWEALCAEAAQGS